jgi:predicted homoserine dehydrogenase-like protein
VLDGEGGYTVVGRLMPAEDSLAQGCLPLGLAHGWKMLKPVAAGRALSWSDVAFDANVPAVRLRREMESSGSSGSDKSRYGQPLRAAG